MFHRRSSLYCKAFVRSALLVLLFSACQKSSPPPEPMDELTPLPPTTIEHTVKYSGETLGLISRWYTGKSSNWKAIQDSNPGLDPRKINLGNVILVPSELVVKEAPMPKEFVGSRESRTDSVPEEVQQSSETATEEVADSSVEETEPEMAEADTPVEQAKLAGSDNSVDDLTADERLRRDLEAALAEEVDAEQGKPISDEAGSAASVEEVDRDSLLDELLAE